MNKIIKKISEEYTNYLPIPFWSWNDALDPKELRRQIRWMKNSGIGGFFMHARGGLKTEYMSEEWMKCVESCCEEAEELGLDAWAYDENGWPSGFCGGKLLEEEENRDMFILYKIGAYDVHADVSYSLDKEKLCRVHEGEEISADQYLNLYLHRSVSTVDVLNPDVVDKFINNTHEQYKVHFGQDFAKKIKGFFTDEPQYYREGSPYTPMVQKYFKERYKEDIMDGLGLLFVEKEGYRAFRYRYWLAMQTLIVQNYGKKVYDWCEKNGVKLTGHYVEENGLMYQMMFCAGIMPLYEYMHLPGIDWLGKAFDPEIAPRQLSSVAHQLGKKQMITETFAICGWDISPTELRRIAGIQYVCGVNRMCHHLVPYSEHGQRKRDYPAHYHPVNPWVKENFKDFNEYFAKLGTMLGEGEEPVNVAMLHPIRSEYFEYKWENFDWEELPKLDVDFRKACRTLSSQGVAYHFLDETLLEQHGYVDGASIGCGICNYQYLVLPTMYTMGANTEKLLRQFVENGGKILLLDERPEYLEGERWDYSYLNSNCTLEEILQSQPFRVKSANNDLYYAYRVLEGKPFLYVQNYSDKEYTQTFYFGEKIRSFIVLDLLRMNTYKLPLNVTFPENGALILFPSEEEAHEEKRLTTYELMFEKADVKFEHNFLTLDMVRYSKDGEQYSEPLLRNKLFSKLLSERYEGRLWLKYDFEIRKIPKELMLLAEKDCGQKFYVNGKTMKFYQSYEDEPTLWLADISGMVREGWNNYEVVMLWHQTEETYYALFGEGVTEGLKNCISYESEIEDVYLAGKFGVYSAYDYEEYDSKVVCGHDFYIDEAPVKVSEPTVEGLPFFRGKLILSQTVILEDNNTLLKVKGRYQTARVYVNEQYAGELFFEHQIDISQYAVRGENLIKIEFTISNRNVLGPFHYAGAGDGGPNCFEAYDLPESKEGRIRYKLCRFYPEEN